LKNTVIHSFICEWDFMIYVFFWFLSFWQWLSDAINATHHRSRGNFIPGAPRRHLRLLAAAGGSSLAKLDVVVGVVSGKIVTKAYPLVNEHNYGTLFLMGKSPINGSFLIVC
jgi:hypothetical protein